VNAHPTVSSSENQPGQTSSQGTSTSSDNVNPTATPNANSANPPSEVAKAKPPDSLAGGKPENDATANDTAKSAKGKTKATDEAANEEDEDTAPAEPAKTSAKSAKASAAAAAPTYDNSQVDLAQRYLQGKGVRQDCNRGVSLLRSAARQANPKARIQMAALYLSGHCVEQNLPQAYSWFAQAKELEPNNSWIERNLNSLWSKMTDEERRRVLR
jgi:TPR repeat protein